jgi:vancomycin aglycone glucosyltransferase
MRVLLSTIGSRGDVQPLVALALELRRLDQDVRICAPPDFREWVEGFRIPFFPIGPEVRSTAKTPPTGPTGGPPAPPTPEQIRRMMEGTVATQFETIPKAAEGCDAIVAANALQIAARSIAEKMRIRHVFVSWCPVTLPSPHHAPPAVMAWKPQDPAADPLALWAEDAERWNERWGPALNTHRAAHGLSPVTDVRGHVLTREPWLAADPTLAPWPGPELAETAVFQTGAWILPDSSPLSPEVEKFLDAGEPPVYFGFGSVRASRDLGRSMLEACRALGRPIIVLRGWAGLEVADDSPDCLSIGDVNQQLLFRRVAAVVHHGGAGTTTAATRAGAPQVVIPQHYDQPYFARRVRELGIGTAHPPASPTVASLTSTLDHALNPTVVERARSVAAAVRTDGARVAAEQLAAGR